MRIPLLIPALAPVFVLALAPSCLWSAPPVTAPATATPPLDKVRTWKDTQGRTIEAALRGFDAGDLILWLKDGRVARISLQSLSAEDQYHAVFHAEELAGGLSFTLSVSPSGPGSAPVAAATTTTPPSSVGPAPRITPTPGTSAPSTVPAPAPVPGRVLPAPGRPIGGTWPARVALPLSAVQCRVMSENASAKEFMYQTGHFEYRSEGQLGQAVMSDVSRIFEATYTLLSQSPWGILASPDGGKFRAELFETRGSYIASGAPANSGGVYLLKEKVFRVPFESLGLKQTNRGWTKDENYGTKTLVHELTHMLHHDILPLLPIWAAEGMAEYTECIPFRSSTFWVDSVHDGVKAYNRGPERGRPPPVHSFVEVMTMTQREWQAGRKIGTSRGGAGIPIPAPVIVVGYDSQQALYHSGLLLVYYFMHLEGDGRGARFMQFLEATRKDVSAWRTYQLGFVTYEQQMEAFMKQPGVKNLGGGRFSYPAGMVPPQPPRAPFEGDLEQMPLRHLGILLNGKTAAQVALEAEAALKKAGLELMHR